MYVPPEIWLHILRWATLPPCERLNHSITYRPFEPALTDGPDDELSIKFTVSLVCRQWRALSLPFLYEELHIGRTVKSLVRVLREDDEQGGSQLSRWVRRVCLPYSSSVTETYHPIPALEVLQRCSQLEVLTRRSNIYFSTELRFEFETQCPPLPTLKRLDWWHNNEATRTGGINSLSHVLQVAPNLQYLSIQGEVWLKFMCTSPPDLPALKTLRIGRVNLLFLCQLCRWSLPSLTHVVIDTIARIDIYECAGFWTSFGAQIRTLELGRQIFMTGDFLRLILAGCPNLVELNCYAFFTVPFSHLIEPHNSLVTFGMHAHPNSIFDDITPRLRHVQEHIAALTRPLFPALKEILLYGDWKAVVENTGFDATMEEMRARGLTLRLMDELI